MEKTGTIYCGMNIYINPLTGEQFQKTAGEKFERMDSRQLKVEQRFIKKHAKDMANKIGEVALNG